MRKSLLLCFATLTLLFGCKPMNEPINEEERIDEIPSNGGSSSACGLGEVNGPVLYATEVHVKESSELESGYTYCKYNLNQHTHFGHACLYLGFKFEEYDPNKKGQYITDIICCNSGSTPMKAGETIVYNGHTYYVEPHGYDVNKGAGGPFLYIMYTKENIDDTYVVDHSIEGYYDYWSTDNKFKENFTRIMYNEDIPSHNFSLNEQHKGNMDRNVLEVNRNGVSQGDADFNKGAGGAFIRMFCAHEKAPEFYPRNWMSKLPNDMKVCDVSIPGSHDSYTSTATFASLSCCQIFKVEEQLAMGARFLDVRVGEEYKIQHGSATTDYTYQEGLKVVRDFINAHPTEFAILEVQYEKDNIVKHPVTSEWEKKVDEITTEVLGRENIIAFRPELTVGEVRGKYIVLFSDSCKYSSKLGGDLGARIGTKSLKYNPVFSSNDSTYIEALYLQDYWGIQGKNYKAKSDSVQKCIRNFQTAPANAWCLNYLSASYTEGAINQTSDIAKVVNNDTYNYIKSQNKHMRLGIVAMDFLGTNCCQQAPGVESHRTNGYALTWQIIANNFK